MEGNFKESRRESKTAKAPFTPEEVMAKSFGSRYEFFADRARCGDLKWLKKFEALGGFGVTMEYAGPAMIDACFAGHTELAKWLYAKGARVIDQKARQRLLLQFSQSPESSHLATLFKAPVEDLPGPLIKAPVSNNPNNQSEQLSNVAKPVQTLELLSENANISACNLSGHTALHMAMILGKESRARDLIGRGASLHVEDKHGNNAITYAAARSGMEMIDVIYDSGKLTANEIKQALSESKYIVARHHIDKREHDTNKANKLRKFFLAAFELEDNEINELDRPTIESALADLNFTFDAISYIGMSCYDIERDYFPEVAQIVRWTIPQRSMPEAIDRLRCYWSQTHLATHRGSTSMRPKVTQAIAANLVRWQSETAVDLLLEELTPKDLSKDGTDGEKILQSLKSCVEDIRVIESHRQHPERSLLTLAILKDRLDLLEELIRYRADPNQPDRTGDRPLHVAAAIGSKLMVQRLLLRGAERELRNERNQRAYDLVLHHKSKRLKALLKPK